MEIKACPFCGEEIKAVAIRCKHCHAELPAPVTNEGRGSLEGRLSPEEFEQRFLDFAYRTTEVINAPAVAHALKVPIAEATERLEDLAAGDVLIRHVDDQGYLSFSLPGRAESLVPLVAYDSQLTMGPVVSESTAMLGLLINSLFLPGLGSIVAGKVQPGVAQLVLFIVGIPLSFALVGIPMIITAWIWGLSTAIAALQEARNQRQENG